MFVRFWGQAFAYFLGQGFGLHLRSKILIRSWGQYQILWGRIFITWGSKISCSGSKNLRRLARIFGAALSEIWRSVCRFLTAVAKFKGAKNLTDLGGTPSHRFGTQSHTSEIN